MGTEHPDTGGMHRLFDDALDGVDLTGDVVPNVLTGYDRKIRVRRYQGAGVALAVLATAGAAVTALPRGGGAGAGTVSAASSTAGTKQDTGYCTHQHWAATGAIQHPGPVTLAPDPAPYQANCKALLAAVQAVFPTAQVVPQYNPDLTRDPRVDQTLLKQIDADQYTDPGKWDAAMAKHFGSELMYLAVHPDDPANVYVADQYELVTSAGREGLGVGIANDTTVPGHPEVFVGLAESNSCANIPSVLVGKLHCTSVGDAGGWHGALWNSPAGGVDPTRLTGVATRGHGVTVQLWGHGNDYQAWYHEGKYTQGMGTTGLSGDTWINRWTGQKYQGSAPPTVHSWTEAQWAEFLDSPGFQKFADSYAAYLATQPAPSRAVPSPTHSR